MSRSVISFAAIGSENFLYGISGILSRNGFHSCTENNESVWVNEKEDSDILQYISISCSANALSVSGWIKYKSDENKYKEYAAEQFWFDEYEKIKNIDEAINEIGKVYGNRLKERKLLIYE